MLRSPYPLPVSCRVLPPQANGRAPRARSRPRAPHVLACVARPWPELPFGQKEEKRVSLTGLRPRRRRKSPSTFSSTKSRKRPPSTDSPGPRSSSSGPLGPACCPPRACQRGGQGRPQKPARRPQPPPVRAAASLPSLSTRRQPGAAAGAGACSVGADRKGEGTPWGHGGCPPPRGGRSEEGASRTCGSRWSSASPQSVPTARAPRKPSRGRNRRGPRSRSSSRERGEGRLSSRTARALWTRAGEKQGLKLG